MTAEFVHLDFILIRGPEVLPRRVHVKLSKDGTPATIGRAPNCSVVLDPRLMFSSQVQCQLFSVSTGVKEDDVIWGSTPPREQAGEDGVEVFLMDLCSSNGTFVNGRRIGGTDPTPLREGDRCIFGGMRDVAVGELLPSDAFQGPELVVWMVTRQPSSITPNLPFEATPVLLPTPKAIEEVEKALRDAVAPPGEEATPDHVPQRLFDGISPASPQRPTVELVTHPATTGEQSLIDPSSLSIGGAEEAVKIPVARSTSTIATQRSGRSLSLVAPTPTTAAPHIGSRSRPISRWIPPLPAHFEAVRVGKHTFSSPETARLVTWAAASTGEVAGSSSTPPRQRGAKEKKGRGSAAATKRAKTETNVAPTCTVMRGTPTNDLRFSEAHWMWNMELPATFCSSSPLGSPRGETRMQPCVLPVPSIQAVVACTGRLGLAAQLKEDSLLPLLEPSLTSGSPAHRWLVWRLEDCRAVTKLQAENAASEEVVPHPAPRGKAAAKRMAQVPLPSEPEDIPADVLASSTTFFEYWLTTLEAFYGSKLPPMQRMETEAFDELFSPSAE